MEPIENNTKESNNNIKTIFKKIEGKENSIKSYRDTTDLSLNKNYSIQPFNIQSEASLPYCLPKRNYTSCSKTQNKKMLETIQEVNGPGNKLGNNNEYSITSPSTSGFTIEDNIRTNKFSLKQKRPQINIKCIKKIEDNLGIDKNETKIKNCNIFQVIENKKQNKTDRIIAEKNQQLLQNYKYGHFRKKIGIKNIPFNPNEMNCEYQPLLTIDGNKPIKVKGFFNLKNAFTNDNI